MGMWVFAIIVPVVLIGVVIVVKVMQSSGQESKLARAGLAQLRSMTGPSFEQYLERLFTGLGYRVERPHAGRSAPGVDLILVDGTGRRTAVHTKAWNVKVGPEAVQAMIDGAAAMECQEAMVVTTAGYQDKARQLAVASDAQLWDLDDLAAAASKAGSRGMGLAMGEAAPAAAPPAGPLGRRPQQAAAGSAPAPPPQPEADEPQGPPCPICRTPMQARSAAGKEIWLCARFPRCNGASLRDEQPQ